MTNQEENKSKKVPVTTYIISKEKYFRVYPTHKGYHCFARILGENIEIDKKNLNEIYKELPKRINKRVINLLNDAGEGEELLIRINESLELGLNPLEKLIIDLGGEIRERK